VTRAGWSGPRRQVHLYDAALRAPFPAVQAVVLVQDRTRPAPRGVLREQPRAVAAAVTWKTLEVLSRVLIHTDGLATEAISYGTTADTCVLLA